MGWEAGRPDRPARRPDRWRRRRPAGIGATLDSAVSGAGQSAAGHGGALQRRATRC
ncbi:hypothetical protein HMPREF0731_2700 [Pseudoroseomonas cervicalis ATCC 49957]|uniref:Uncharacterized protein n=1 Tax=Pseudoroseomonas cervicalis ATCC 49957 TaxID=525371 RepID=D5RNN9_9PROT|nr:hypothetical protein HMPREF0731_2700 [Pseudoroseomonas cervicalis ATCC 49957]